MMKQLLLTLALIVPLVASAQQERKYIRDSYKLYHDSLYEQAQDAAVKAMALTPNSYEANYNYANALFQQEKYDEALEKYNQLASGETDKQKLSELYHNIGDCHFAKKEYEPAIDAFKKSLRNNPSDDQTRYNLIATKKLLDDQKNNQNNQNNQDNKQNQDQQQQQQQEQQQQQDQQNQQDQQQQQQQEQKMNRDEAERLLNAIQNDENKLQEERKKMQEMQKRKIEKNW